VLLLGLSLVLVIGTGKYSFHRSDCNFKEEKESGKTGDGRKAGRCTHMGRILP
jgi:hypothetical protein